MPKFGPEFWVRLRHPNSRINQYQPGMNLYQIGMNLYQIGMNLYQIGINSYRFRFSYTAEGTENSEIVPLTKDSSMMMF